MDCMECPFCYLLNREYIGQYVRVGLVCNCDTNDHIYRDGYIQRGSFYNDTIRLYDSPRGGNVIFTGYCDSIFELYIFGGGADATTDAAAMIEQRRNLLKTVEGNLEEAETKNE